MFVNKFAPRDFVRSEISLESLSKNERLREGMSEVSNVTDELELPISCLDGGNTMSVCCKDTQELAAEGIDVRRVPTDGPVEMLSAERGGVGEDFGCKHGSEDDGVRLGSCLVFSLRPLLVVASTELLRDREGVGGLFPGSSE